MMLSQWEIELEFKLVSDLHLDMHKGSLDFLDEGETLVIAGDLAQWDYVENHNPLAEICSRYTNVIYVLGNHEYYGESLLELRKKFWEMEAKHSNLYCLENTKTRINGVVYAGTTLWFPADPYNFRYEKNLSDFQYIRDFRNNVYHLNDTSKYYLSSIKADVWITHHLPHYRSIAPKYRGDELNRFFLSEMGYAIQTKQPKVVVHGHTHIPCHYKLDNTKVYCNPRGYPHEANHHIYKPLEIEVNV